MSSNEQELGALEIHFANEHECSIILQHRAPEVKKPEVLEATILAAYILRQLFTLGRNTATIAAANILQTLDGDYSSWGNYYSVVQSINTEEEAMISFPLIAALGIDTSELLGICRPLIMARSGTRLSSKEFIRQLWPNTPHLVSQVSTRAKGFVCNLNAHSHGVHLYLKHYGFGLLGQGVNYFVPMSIMLLLEHLRRLRPRQSRIYFAVAKSCSALFQAGNYPQDRHSILPIEIAKDAAAANQ